MQVGFSAWIVNHEPDVELEAPVPNKESGSPSRCFMRWMRIGVREGDVTSILNKEL